MSDTSREDRIRARAHELWLRAGNPPQHDNHFWVMAEKEIDAEDKLAPPAAPAPSD